MKKLVMTGLVILILSPVSFSQELSGEDIIKKVNEIFNPETNYGKSQMTIVTSSGKKRTFISESWSKNKGEKNLVRYLEPKRIKGQAILMLNNADDIWSYFPRTQRVRKLATHAKKQKMQGSDFSYEDMEMWDYKVDFESKILGNEKIKSIAC